MTIEVTGTVGIVSTKIKPYWIKRKGYFVGKRWVKPNRIRRFKKVPIVPFLSGYLELKVDADLVLGGVYVDENEMQYACIQKMALGKAVSILKNVSTNLGTSFSNPKELVLIMRNVCETSTRTD